MVQQAPRTVLKKLIADRRGEGLRVKTGVEAEFFLISPDGKAISDEYDTASKPCYDQQALMRRYDVIAEICDCMLELGWGPYQNDHEDANGQFEMNWDFDDALITADRHSFFKFMVKSIAEKHGLRATFMPKPFPGLTGNGCHAHLLGVGQDRQEEHLRRRQERARPVGAGLHFLGGIMKHAEALAAITNPTVNSYKRINAPRTLSGRHLVAEHGDLDRQQPHPHGARARPGPLRAAPARRRGEPLSAAGRDPRRRPRRHRHKADPGKRYDIDMYQMGHTVKGAPKLPLNLLDALRAFDKDKSLKAALGEEFSAAYLKLKHQEWNSLCVHFTHAGSATNTLEMA